MAEVRKRAESLKNIIFFLFIVVFFVSIIVFYYFMLYDETKGSITKQGAMDAVSTAEQINRYLQNGMECIALQGYTLDKMILDDRPVEDMLEFIVDQTSAVSNIMPDTTTGVYALIDGQYLDGAGWVPDVGYFPTERPWYIQARAGMGKVVVVDPYVDLETGSVMITLAKLLCDGKSVVAMDMSMDQLQYIVWTQIEPNDKNLKFILDKNYKVIAHPDKNEIGMAYLKDADTLGCAIVREFRKTGEDSFSVNFDNTEYMVYTFPLENGWQSFSVIDTTLAYSRLKKPLILTIIVSILFCIFMAIMMLMSRRQRLLAEKLEKETESALEASEAKSAFLANMSHEIRTPINAILGMNEMVLRECDDEEILSYSESVKAAGQTLLGIVNDILDFSKIEAGKLEIIPVDYDLSSLLNDLVNMVHSRADDKGLMLNLDFDSGIPKELRGDEVRIKQIITNILTNAVKYTEKGGINFSVGYERVPDDPDSVLLKVAIADTGIGIHREDVKKLFIEFERIDESRNRRIEGTGLGMSITKNLLEKMGSSLEVKSDYGKGSIFSFSLLQQVKKWEPLGDIDASCNDRFKNWKKYKEKFTAPDATVLVVDDNPMNLMVFKSLIKQTLINIDTADDGDEGIVAAKRKKYDIIFLDHMMPGKDGIETLRIMKKQKDSPNLNTPVICLTANAISGAREKYIAEGFDDYLTKPIDPVKLEEMLLHLLPGELIKEPAEDGDDALSGGSGETPEELKALEGQDLIDVKAGLNSSGSPDAYMNLLNLFYSSIDSKADELNGLFNSEDFTNYTIKVHALKSSLRIIGALDLGEEAQALENAGKAGDTDYITDNHPSFLEKYLGFKELLRPVCGDNGNKDLPEADRELMKEVFDELLAAARDMDSDRLESIFAEMKDYRIPAEDQALFSEAEEAAGAYDYDRLVNILL